MNYDKQRIHIKLIPVIKWVGVNDRWYTLGTVSQSHSLTVSQSHSLTVSQGFWEDLMAIILLEFF